MIIFIPELANCNYIYNIDLNYRFCLENRLNEYFSGRMWMLY